MASFRSHTQAFLLATRLLSVLPVPYPKDAPQFAEEKPSSYAGVGTYLPHVGFLLGLIGVLVSALLTMKSPGSNLAYLIIAALTLVVLTALTRMMHFDGLADVIDGLFGAYEQQRRREIMKDSFIGSFGVVAIVLAALLFVLLFAELLYTQLFFALVFITTFGRFSATCAAWFGKPAATSGLGYSICKKPEASEIIATAVVLIIVAAILYVDIATVFPWEFVLLRFLLVIIITAGAAYGVPVLLAKPFGGVTGDVMGASIVITELISLVTMILVVVW